MDEINIPSFRINDIKNKEITGDRNIIFPTFAELFEYFKANIQV